MRSVSRASEGGCYLAEVRRPFKGRFAPNMVKSRNHPAVRRDLMFTFCIAEVLAADRAGPVFAVACSLTSRCYRFRLGQRVPLRRDHPAVLCDLIIAFCVAEVLATDHTGPVFAVSGSLAGRSYSSRLDRRVALRRNHPAILGNLMLTSFIAEELVAAVAAPVCAVAGSRAGRFDCRMCCHVVAKLLDAD